MESNSYSLILLRGLPGSGKTTLSKVLSDNHKWPVFSVDDYFVNEATGEYLFDYKSNHLAYQNCLNKAEKAMKALTEKVFIDNTLTLDWEIEPYFKLAAKYHYRVFVVTVENRHHGQNQHQISQEQIQKMAQKYKVVLY